MHSEYTMMEVLQSVSRLIDCYNQYPFKIARHSCMDLVKMLVKTRPASLSRKTLPCERRKSACGPKHSQQQASAHCVSTCTHSPKRKREECSARREGSKVAQQQTSNRSHRERGVSSSFTITHKQASEREQNMAARMDPLVDTSNSSDGDVVQQFLRNLCEWLSVCSDAHRIAIVVQLLVRLRAAVVLIRSFVPLALRRSHGCIYAIRPLFNLTRELTCA